MENQTDALEGASVLHIECFEAVVMLQGYSDSLVFLLIDLLPAKEQPE